MESTRGSRQNYDNNNNKENDVTANITGEVSNDVVILTLDYKFESWVIASGASFYAIASKECLKNYMCKVIWKSLS